MFFFPVLLVVVFAGFVVQQFLPPLPGDVRIYLLPLLVFYSAVATPFWMMLIVAAAAGVMLDAFQAQIMTGVLGPDGTPLLSVEIAVGWSILLNAILGAIMSGFRPVFIRGRWDVYLLVSFLAGVFTSAIVAIEFIIICFRRGGFVYTRDIGLRVAGSGLVAFAIAPALFICLNILARLCHYEPHPERADGR